MTTSLESLTDVYSVIAYALTFFDRVMCENMRIPAYSIPEEMLHRENSSRGGEPRVVIESRYTPN